MWIEGSKREERRPRDRQRLIEEGFRSWEGFILNKVEQNRIDLFYVFHSK